jgi:hypothetical protein
MDRATWLRNLICGVVTACALLSRSRPALAVQVVGTPVAVFSQDPDSWAETLLSLSVLLNRSSVSSNVQFQTLCGTPIGAPVTVVVPASGQLDIAVPAAAATINNRMVVSVAGEPDAMPVVWYPGQWAWGSVTVTLTCTGACFSNGAIWSISGAPVLRAGDSVVGARTVTVVGSQFTVNWQSQIDVSQAIIADDGSFIALSDHSRISYPAGQIVGAQQVVGPLQFLTGICSVTTSGGVTTAVCSTNGAGVTSNPTTSVLGASANAPAAPPLILLILAIAFGGIAWRRTATRRSRVV